MTEKENLSKDSREFSPEDLPDIVLEENKKVDIGAQNNSKLFLDDVIHFNDLPKVLKHHILEKRVKGELPENKNLFSKYEILKDYADSISSEDVDKIFERAKEEKIHFDDLPKIWQEHILKRRADEVHPMPTNRTLFSRAEILEATSDEKSFTSPTAVNNIFERAKKQKINLNDLPKSWQEILSGPRNKFTNVTIEDLKTRGASEEDIANYFERAKKEKIAMADLPEEWRKILEPENKFTNVTIEDLKTRGASEEDIAKIKTGAYRKKTEEREIEKLKEEITEKMAVEPKELEANVDKAEEQTVKKPSLWSRFKSLWK
ncbi:MAG: hypothetical protein WC806_06500 [Candidatus Gracilibacteria bacterium]|jgi:hypothetical protein